MRVCTIRPFSSFVFDREGGQLGVYRKAHPAPSEVRTAALKDR